MKIAVVGAGALGAVYGVRLALLGKQEVTFVVREARAKRSAPLLLERIDADAARHELEAPTYLTSVPHDADVIIVTVRQDQLGDDLVALLAPSKAPIVILTPMFPDDEARLVKSIGARIFPTMPNVVSYDKNGAIRYWLPKSATTAIESTNAPAALGDLMHALVASGITAQMKKAVLSENVATMVCFMPIAFALDIAGGVDALMKNGPLLRSALDAMSESRALAKTIGSPASWASLLLPFVGSFTLKAGVALAKRRSPEAVHYVEEHFGRKLHAQNLHMAEWMVSFAAQTNANAEELRALTQQLAEVA